VAAYFFDSSALVKRFAKESGTSWVISLLKPANANRIYIARITYVEVISAIIRRVKGNSLSKADGAKAVTRFRRAFEQNLLKVEISSGLINTAARLAENYSLRAYDAVQLAAALEIHAERRRVNAQPIILVSADNDLNATASSEGLIVDNPNLHP
jgi:uncharacterized protein